MFHYVVCLMGQAIIKSNQIESNYIESVFGLEEKNSQD